MKYGFIGLGNMGHFMAGHCLDAGYELAIPSMANNKEELEALVKKGAKKFNTNAEVGQNAERVFLALPNGNVCEQVIHEITEVEGSIVKEIYDFSTVGPTYSKKFGEEGLQKGYQYYDCPMAGGVTGAEAGTLTIMIGCNDDEFETVKEVVSPMGKNIMHAGPLGSGSAVKMFNNYLGGTDLVACCEVMVMAKQLGMDLENLFNIINKSTGRNFASENAIPGFLKNRDFTPGFATDLFYKDINIALQTADELKMALSIGPSTLQAFGAARAMGFGQEHSIAVVKYYEALAGIKVNEEKE